MTVLPRRLAVGVASAAILLTGQRGFADEPPARVEAAPEAGRLPTSYADRPLTLPRLVLAPAARFEVVHDEGTRLDLALAAAFGVTDDFELEAVVAPLQLWPSVTYGEVDQPGPEVGATYRAYGGGQSGAAEVGLHVDATAITLPHSSGIVVNPGLLIRNHGRSVRVDSGVFVRTTAAATTAVGLDAPLALAVNVTESFHLGASTGISLPTFDDVLGLAIPLGAFAGYRVDGTEGPLLEIDPFFRWPRLIGSSAIGESTTSTFQAGVAVRWFLYL